ncbi:MAG: FHA domain-containing protein [Chloroflexi bacterium]|jgi:ABC-type multidrug transport system ATPase subunit/predicted component of type VI protein secretion system|nr:FHA domain-containing protein [Chloroflexota bacterium]
MSISSYILQIQVLHKSSKGGDEYPVLKGELKLGRRPDNDVVLDNSKVSGRHAKLIFDREALLVVDLDSRNGTRLNGQPLPPQTPTPFRPGDVMTIGPFALRVREAKADAPALSRRFRRIKVSDPSQPKADDVKSCPQCNAPVRANARFCAYCGATVDIALPVSRARVGGEHATLVVRRPGKQPVEYDLKRGKLQAGRGPRNDIVLDYPTVSVHHLQLDVGAQDIQVTDLDSTNGTQINGRLISPRTPRPFRLGDVIRIGSRRGDSLTMRLKRRQAESLRMQPLGLHELSHFPSVVIGRSSGSQVTLNHPMVSREHAEIMRQSGGYAIRDLGSMNGTFVNGQRMNGWQQLRTGDVIQIGPFKLVYDGRVESLATAVSQGHRLDALRLGKQVESGLMILKDISMAVQGGEFIALVGGSGAGKSTLVKAMNGFNPATHGRMLINGDDLYTNLDAYRTLMAYVPQDDIIHKKLPVRLALWYAAKLRLPDASNREIEQRIASVLKSVDMTQHAEKPVYVLSGGQRKRVSIAVELLSQPELLFLDEPTSGLDPGLEKKMMYDLNRLADQGQTVVLVTHATANIEQCDQVAFLSRGYLAYYGPPHEAIDYFQAQDFADIYMKLSQESDPATWNKKYRRSSICRQYVKERQAPILKAQRQSPQQRAPQAQRRPRPTRDSALRQIGVLARRHLDLIRHDWITLFILLIMMPIISLLFMAVSAEEDLVGWQIPQSHVEMRLRETLEANGLQEDDQASYMPEPTAAQLITMLGLALTQAGTFGAAFEIVKERSIFLRERSVNLQPGAYVVSKILVLGMFAVIQVASSLFILSLKVSMDFDPILGLFPTGSMELFVTLLLGVIASIMLGLFISAIVPTADIVLYVILGQLFAQIILSGAMFPLEDNLASKLVISHWTMDAMGSTVNIPELNEEGLTCKVSVVEMPTETDETRGEKRIVCQSAAREPEELGLNYEHTAEHLLTTWIAFIIQTFFWGGVTMIVQARKKFK